MNVIVSNKYGAMLSNLNIDLIKSINGEFEVDDLISQFTNFFFNKMILDITAIKNYQDINVIQKLSFNFDMNKVILVLDDSEKVIQTFSSYSKYNAAQLKTKKQNNGFKLAINSEEDEPIEIIITDNATEDVAE